MSHWNLRILGVSHHVGDAPDIQTDLSPARSSSARTGPSSGATAPGPRWSDPGRRRSLVGEQQVLGLQVPVRHALAAQVPRFSGRGLGRTGGAGGSVVPRWFQKDEGWRGGARKQRRGLDGSQRTRAEWSGGGSVVSPNVLVERSVCFSMGLPLGSKQDIGSSVRLSQLGNPPSGCLSGAREDRHHLCCIEAREAKRTGTCRRGREG